MLVSRRAAADLPGYLADVPVVVYKQDGRELVAGALDSRRILPTRSDATGAVVGCPDRVRVLILLCVLAHVAWAETVVGYRNGKAIQLEVTDVDGVPIEAATARAFIAMRDAAAEAGVYLQPWSGFRSNEKQAQLYEDWKAGVGNPAAKPGYSNHQSGRALDINLLGVPKETYAWLLKNAARYGFHRTVASEPWHWELSPPRPSGRSRR